MKLEPVLRKFDEYMNPKKNIPYLRYKFFSYNQSEGQNIDDYVTELKLKSTHCEFGLLKENLRRDRIVAGVRDTRVQERLLREPDLTLDKAMSICRAAEETKKQSEEMQSKTSPNQVDQLRHRKDKPRNRGKQDNQGKRDNQRKIYLYCVSQHDKGRCPAYGKLCKKCGNRNHFAKVCLSNQIKEMNERDDNHSSQESIEGGDNILAPSIAKRNQ